jgi:hypothetical protein
MKQAKHGLIYEGDDDTLRKPTSIKTQKREYYLLRYNAL